MITVNIANTGQGTARVSVYVAYPGAPERSHYLMERLEVKLADDSRASKDALRACLEALLEITA